MNVIRWSFEIGIGGEDERKFCELISGIKEVFGIPDQVKIAKKKYLSVNMRDFKAATYSRLSKTSWGGGDGEQIAKVGNKREKTAGTREHKPIFEGNKGTRTPPGRPSCQLPFTETLADLRLSLYPTLAHSLKIRMIH